MLEQKLLVRRRMEASARLVVREAEERARRDAQRDAARRAKEQATSARLAVREAEESARREAQRDAVRRAKEQARREAGLAEAKLDARAEARQAEARQAAATRDGTRRRGLAAGAPRKEGHFCQDRYGDWWEVAGEDQYGIEFCQRCDAQGVAEALELVRLDTEEWRSEMRRRRQGRGAR
jgi:hypothetical protein